jgi:hypothetical protein
LAAEELHNHWDRLRHKYPQDFAFNHCGSPKIPARDPKLKSTSLDLTRHYNASLQEAGNPTATNASATPHGLQTFDSIEFDLRGLVQLAGSELATWGARPFPEAVTGIDLNDSFVRLHLLHGTTGFEQTGQRVASLFLHYADGEMREIPIIAGEDVGDWQSFREGGGVGRAKVVWSGRQVPSRVWTRSLHWYKSSWDNPRPGHPVTRIDYVSAMGRAGPYLLAATIER